MSHETIFFNEAGRLRGGWRFAVFLVSYTVLSYVSLVILFAFLAQMPIGFTSESLLSPIATFSVLSFLAIVLGWFYGKVFEDLPFRALGFWTTKNWLKNLLFGLLVGALSIGLAALIAAAFGGLRFQFNEAAGSSAIWLTLSVTLVIFTAGAVSEEALFRGYLLQTLSRSQAAIAGVLLTSFLFATAHNNNPNATYVSWLNTFIAGIWFCAAYFKTRDLWFAFGIHLAWNWVQGSILGISVSGLSELTSAPLFRAADLGPVWLTGGGYGIEGGFACTIALILSTVAIYFMPFVKPNEELLMLSSQEIPTNTTN